MKEHTNIVIAVLVLVVAAAATAARVTPVAPAAGPSYKLTIVSPLTTDTYPAGINDSGAIAATGDRAYVFEHDKVRDLGPGTSARGINNSGAVCGWSGGACWWPKNKGPIYISPDMPLATPYAINNRNQIVGEVAGPPTFSYVPFVYDGKLTVLSAQQGAAMAINDQGIIGGCVDGYYWFIPCLWVTNRRGYARIDLPLSDGDFGGGVRSINKRGEAAGWAETYAKTMATIWRMRGKGYVAEYLPDADSHSVAMSLNNRGQVVGCIYGGWDSAACLWNEGRIDDLNELVADSQGCTLQIAVGINDSGQIACRARYSGTGRSVAVLLTPIHKR